MSSTIDDQLHGVLPVLQTPFTTDLEIDCDVLRREIDWAFDIGAQGVVTGMVSEITRLSQRGRNELAALVCDAANGRGYSVISVGAENAAEAVKYAQDAERFGATAVMATPPVTKLLGRDATRDYFAKIAKGVSIPLIIQDASSYVGTPIDLDVYVSLLNEFGDTRIYFKPEASPLGPNLSRLRDATAGAARIFEGSGGINLVDCYRRGIAGTMPGMDLLDGIVALWQALEAGDNERIYELAFPISSLVALQLQAGLDGFLAIEKHLLKARGIFANTIQLPPINWELDAETQEEVDRLFARIELALRGSQSEFPVLDEVQHSPTAVAAEARYWSDGIIG